MKLNGIFLAMATPFDHRGEIYVSKIHENVSRWNRVSMAGYAVGTPAGESALLNAEEKIRLWEEVARASAPEKLLLAATDAESVRESVRLIHRAAETGYKAALVQTPCLRQGRNPASQTQLLFFRSVADQVKIPVILAETASRRLAAETAALLAEHPNIIGIHHAHGDARTIIQSLGRASADFQVMTGSALTLYPCFMLGVSGAILAFANAAPYICLSLEEAVRTREHKAAHELQDRIFPAALAAGEKYGVPGLKYAMDLRGYYGGVPRLPLAPPDAAAKRDIEEAFHGIKS